MVDLQTTHNSFLFLVTEFPYGDACSLLVGLICIMNNLLFSSCTCVFSVITAVSFSLDTLEVLQLFFGFLIVSLSGQTVCRFLLS